MHLKWSLVAILFVLGACKPTDTRIVTDTRPPVVIERVRYVPVPASLTRPCPVARGSVSQVIEVARARRAALESCNADKAAIAGIQGTPVK